MQLKYTYNSVFPGLQLRAPLPVYYHGANLKGFNGQEKDDEVSGSGNSYTAEYWQYDSRLGRRWNIDPVFKEFESPYACFANNTIAFTDPNGRDTIDVINSTGEMNRISGGGNDVFRIIDETGKVLNTKEFEKGTIQFTWTYKNSSEETDLPINVLQIKGNYNALQVFEFFAENCEVEFSCIETKRGSSENGFITTSHQKSLESGGGVLLQKKLLVENYIIKAHTHNHPSNNPKPSGGRDHPTRGTKGTWGDLGFAKWLAKAHEEKHKKKGMKFVPSIQFRIYTPKGKNGIRYTWYDEDGIID